MRVVEGDSILVPGFAGTRIVGRAWSSADRAGSVLSANPTDDAEATIDVGIPVPSGFAVEPRAAGGLARWTIAEGVVSSVVDYQVRAEAFSTNPDGEVLSSGRLSVTAPDTTLLIPAARGHWVRARVRAVGANGAHSGYTLWDEAQVPHTLLPPQDWAVAALDNGDVQATWTEPPDPLRVVEIEVVREVPDGNVVSERRLNVRDGSLSQVVDTAQALDKTVRARARYASGVRPTGEAHSPFSPWTDYRSATVVLDAAPSVTCVATDDTATWTIGVVVGAHDYDYREKTSDDSGAWLPAPANREVVIPDLDAETDYTYEFRGRNDAGTSPVTEHTCTTLAGTEPIPAAPALSLTLATSTGIVFGISLPAGASRVEWARSADGPWTRDNDRQVGVSGLAPDTAYTFYARACNAAGCSAPASNVFRTLAATTPTEDAPDQTTCAFTKTSSSITGTIAATARAFTPANGGYQYRYSGGGISLTSWADADSNRQFTISNLRPATAYTIRWRAVGAGGNGQEDNEVVTTDEAPSIPTPSMAIHSRTNNSLTVELGAVTGNPTGYAARAGRTGNYTASPGARANVAADRRVTITGLAAGTAHLIQGIAVRGAVRSDPVEGTWKTLPDSPTATVDESTNSLAVTINAVTGADRYRIRHGATAATLGSWTNIPSGGRTHTIANLTAGTDRVVEVAAGHDQGWSASRQYTWTTSSVTLAAPGGLRTTNIGTTSANLAHNAVPGAASYEWREPGDVTWTPYTGLAFTAGGLTAATSTTIEVRAVAGSNRSPASSISFTTAPASPQVVVTKRRNKFIWFQVGVSTGAASEQWQLQNSNGTWPTQWRAVPANNRIVLRKTWKSDGTDNVDLSLNTTYRVRVRACNAQAWCSTPTEQTGKTTTAVGRPTGVRLSKYRYPAPAIFRPDHYGLRLDFSLPSDCQAVDIQWATNPRYRVGAGLLGAVIDILNFLPVTTWIGVVGQVLTQANRALGLNLDPFGSGAPGLAGVVRFKGFSGSGPFFITWPLGESNPTIYLRFRAVRGNGDELDADTSALVSRSA